MILVKRNAIRFSYPGSRRGWGFLFSSGSGRPLAARSLLGTVGRLLVVVDSLKMMARASFSFIAVDMSISAALLPSFDLNHGSVIQKG